MKRKGLYLKKLSDDTLVVCDGEVHAYSEYIRTLVTGPTRIGVCWCDGEGYCPRREWRFVGVPRNLVAV